MIKLTITEKGGETKALSFDQEEVVIGRVQGNDIVIPKGNISKRHTKLSANAGKLTVTDLKSTNGTYVNGRKIGEPTAVRGGDKIFVGDFLIVLDPGSAAAETTSSSGARRLPGGPPPPPPPPPRAGRRSGAHPVAASEASGSDFGLPGDRPPTTASGRPFAPPPPPPPRPTIMRPGLEDDSADIGIDGPPPSLADVAGIDPDDSLGDLASPLPGRGATTQGDGPIEDVFGSEAAEDEDAHAEFSHAAAPSSVSGRARLASPAFELPSETEGEGAPTPPPVSLPPSGPISGRHGERVDRVEKEPSGAASLSLESLLSDPTVTAIVITPGAPIEVERGGKLESVGEIGDRGAVAEAVWLIANTANPPPAGDNPIVDVRLPDGTHVTALFPPVTAAPVCAVIRKATGPEIPLLDVAGSPDVEKILAAALASRRSLLLAGDPYAVTTLAGALAGAFPAERRIVSIGAGAKSRPGWTELAPGGDPATLIRAAVAFRAQHLLIADLGGAELPDVLLAVARGQDGVIASVAARSAAEALSRLRAFSIGALGAAAFPTLVTSTIDLVVFATTTPTGVRIVEIAEPAVEGDALVPVFVAKRPDANRTTSTLDVTGVSTRLAAAIAVAGDGLAPHLIRQ